MSAPDLDRLNAADPGAAAAVLAPLFEGAPRFLARLVAARPFDGWASLFEAARAIAHAMPEVEQVELIDAHPRLGAPPAAMSELSRREQGGGGPAERTGGPAERRSAGAATGPAPAPAQAPADVAAELARLNAAYEARFGFRYCVFVAGRSRSALLPDMAASLGASRDAELHRALDAVVDIASARLEALRGSAE